MGYNPTYPTYTYNQGYNPLANWDEPPSSWFTQYFELPEGEPPLDLMVKVQSMIQEFFNGKAGEDFSTPKKDVEVLATRMLVRFFLNFRCFMMFPTFL